MATASIAVDVNCNLSVSRDTAEACLKLVEFYINSNEDCMLRTIKNENGRLELYLIDTEEEDNETY